MGYIFYGGLGILVHLAAWGGEWYGLYSLALVLFWPFFLFYQLILLGVFYVLPVVVIVLAGAYVYDHYTSARGRGRWTNK